MSTNLSYDFSVNKEEKSITVKRVFAAERSFVWDAFTKREMLDQWWAPKPWKAKTKTIDFREGGHWHYAMLGPDGEEHWALVDYFEIDFQKSFTGLDAFADANGLVNKDLPQSNWKVSFTDLGKETMVQFNISYDDLEQLETTIQMGFKEGLAMALEGLDDVLASIEPPKTSQPD